MTDPTTAAVRAAYEDAAKCVGETVFPTKLLYEHSPQDQRAALNAIAKAQNAILARAEAVAADPGLIEVAPVKVYHTLPETHDLLYLAAVGLIVSTGKGSTSFIQRVLGIGYNKAAGLMERMEADGIVAKPDHVGKRIVLAAPHRAAERG